MVRKRSNRKILSKRSFRSKRLSRKLSKRLTKTKTKTKKYKRLSRKSKRLTKRINKKRLSRKSKRKKKNKKEKIKKRGGANKMLGHGERRCPGEQCLTDATFEAVAVGVGDFATTGADSTLMATWGEGPTKKDDLIAREMISPSSETGRTVDLGPSTEIPPAPEQEPAQAPASSPASSDAAERELTLEQEKFKSDVNEKLGIIFKDVEKSGWLNKLIEYHELLEEGKHEVGEIIYRSQTTLDDLYEIPKELHGHIFEWFRLIEGIEKDKKLLDAVKKYEDPKKNELKTESYSFVMSDGTIQTFHDLIYNYSNSNIHVHKLNGTPQEKDEIFANFDKILLKISDQRSLKSFLEGKVRIGPVNRFLKITNQINITIPIDMLFELLRETEDDNGKLELIEKIRENGFPILDLFTLLKKLNKVQELFERLLSESRDQGRDRLSITNDNFVDELMYELSDFLVTVTGEAPGGRGKHAANDALLEKRKSDLKLFIKDSIDKTGLLIYLKDFDRLSEKFDKLIEKYEGFIKKKNMITYEVQLEGAAYPLKGEILNHNFNNLNNVINRIIILIKQMNRLSIKSPDPVKVTYEGIPEQEIEGSDFERIDIKDKSFKINFESEEINV
jgi:hypothetical protein